MSAFVDTVIVGGDVEAAAADPDRPVSDDVLVAVQTLARLRQR